MNYYIRCVGCGEFVDVPDEMAGGDPYDDRGELFLNEPYYCDACEIAEEEEYQ